MLAGDLAKFSVVIEASKDKFQNEGTLTLIQRLRHNVIKTGIKSIALSYSRISLAGVAEKLQLDSPEDAEYIIAKVHPLNYQNILYKVLSGNTVSIFAIWFCLSTSVLLQAIRDGVIEASIDHENGYVQSRDSVDLYSTSEPLKSFHQRIRFCLDIHNHSIKAMR